MKIVTVLILLGVFWTGIFQREHRIPSISQTPAEYKRLDSMFASMLLVGPPKWSPDGNYIAFTTESSERSDIWVMENDGLNIFCLTTNFEAVGTHFSWDPSSERIAFEVNSSEGLAVWIVDRDGSEPTNLSTMIEINEGFRISDPEWSPNGRYIGLELTSEARTDIILVDLETHDVRNITNEVGTVNREVSWSPDSQYVAIFSREQISTELQEWSLPEILVISVDGSLLTNVTQPGLSGLKAYLPIDAKIVAVTSMNWSPTENIITFSVMYDQTADIFLIDKEGEEPFNLTKISFLPDLSPAWSPDGEKIAFVTQYPDGATDIWVINADEIVPTNLTFDGKNKNWFPAWSPDGEKIAFQSNRGGVWNIWIMNSDGSKLVNLTGDHQWYRTTQ